MDNQIIVGLPAFNEESALPRIIEKINLLGPEMRNALQIVVVNDGSTDDTGRVLQELSEAFSYVSFVTHPSNLGLGQAMNTLFEYVVEHYSSGDILFTLDADNTHNPCIIPIMADKLKAEKLDLVIASRFVPGGKELGLSLSRKMLSRGARLFFKLFFPIENINDYSSGFRGYSVQYLKKAIHAYHGNLITSGGFECTAEIIARFSKIGVKAAEYPLVLEYDLKEGKSKMRVMRTIMGYFNLVRKVKRPSETNNEKVNNMI